MLHRAEMPARLFTASPTAVGKLAGEVTSTRPDRDVFTPERRAASKPAHDGLFVHQPTPGEQIFQRGAQPAIGVDAEGDAQPRTPVAWRVRRG